MSESEKRLLQIATTNLGRAKLDLDEAKFLETGLRDTIWTLKRELREKLAARPTTNHGSQPLGDE